ncbi:FAD dependent oxidoreductase [Laetiporus sulphureus 93-53]|uniref:FAD dependent oxidoreductase n=1 Tax=Laetiporus sulphureus 93-53 TaxID=1314785 RepID=A0A165B060_9APHY|nr:FAD dependent oxidoreductase [Laetiporus sulphureus 93-53]KZS99979.1 FAD dependent oxidoreductase [Laetiporus sulphureus 93-53]
MLSVGPGPTRKPTSERVLVVGGGVTGLTTAWALLDAGYNVTVVSECWANLQHRITSQIAGALWEWPPAVCGRHTDVISLEHSKGWAMTSYHVFEVLMRIFTAEVHGVRVRRANFFFDRPLENIPDQYQKMQEISRCGVTGFNRDPTLITKHAVNQEAGVIDSYCHDAPVIDTDHYMIWLRALVEAKGAELITARVSGDLLTQEDELLAKYRASAIVNATGLDAWETADDKTVYPLRGALIRVVNDGTKFPKVTEALAVGIDDAHREGQDLVFIVPRNDNILILGGIAQPREWNLDLTLDSPEIVRMRERCNHFVPGLANADYDPSAPFVQGNRPTRGQNVRVERESRLRKDGKPSRIVHSYGQGGSGFSLSFGCAGDVLGLVKEVAEGKKAVTMSGRLPAERTAAVARL